VRDLVLVRHAVAEPRDFERWPDDSLRPLTPDGIERFRAVARGLRRIEVEVEAVLASPYARAWATGEILHEEATWPPPEECPALEPPKPLSAVVDVVRARGDAAVALVGHQPQLSELAALLLAGRERSMRIEIKKGGAMFLRFASTLEPGAAALRWSASPKILRTLGG
jgi:phosphohistidine phosphatase